MRRLAAVVMVLLTADARAQSSSMVLGQSLALLGLAGGLVAGGLAAFKLTEVRFGNSFLVYLGVLCAAASTWVGSLDAVPLTLVLGAAAGVLPFATAFFGLRWCLVQLRARRSKSQPPTD